MMYQTLLITLSLALVSAVSVCGNGVQEGSEQCDDGNLLNGDGCSVTCQLEAYYRCDNSFPNICKIDAEVSLSVVGISRITSANFAVILFQPNYDLPLFRTISFTPIFSTSIPSSGFLVEHISSSNLIKATVAYSSTLESTSQNVQLQLSSTNLFWYDSQITTFQVTGANCQLTWEETFWLQDIFWYVVLGVVVVSVGVLVASIFFEKWIGLELIQTYQSVYYILILLPQNPWQFTPLIEPLRFTSGYDDIFSRDYQTSYTLPNQLLGLGIQKEFMGNVNIGLCMIGAVVVGLLGLAIEKMRLKWRLESEVNSAVKKRLEKVGRWFDFLFGEVFVFVMLLLMFKIINSFAVQLSQASEKIQIYPDELNSTFGMLAFLVLFGVVFFILNWYAVIPDSLTEDTTYLCLRFRNMRFSYPVVYLLYQTIFICLTSLYYTRDFTVYILLGIQIAYAAFLFLLHPYNTPRKINRILHNGTILYNQIFLTLLTGLAIRWKIILARSPTPAIATQFQVYLFIIFVCLVTSTSLAVVRLCIFNKDVQCCLRNQDDDHEEARPLDQPIKRLEQEMEAFRKNSGSDEREEEPISAVQNLNHFLNGKYSNWRRETNEQLKKSKSSVRLRKIRSTNSRLAELIKTPLDHFIESKLQSRPDSTLLEN